MATMRQPPTFATLQEAPPSSVRFDWIMVLLTIWGIAGLFLDGWAHTNLPQLETFFTPWHAVLYSGYLAVAATLVSKTISNRKKAASGKRASGALPSVGARIRNNVAGAGFLEAVPAGYGLSLLGVGIFAVSGVADLTWHLLFGIERSVEALLSPTHLGLALGGGLVATGPQRAAWRRGDGADAGTWRHLGPAILSLIMTLSLLTFFTEYASPFVNPWPVYPPDFLAGYGPAIGITDILLHTGLLMSFVLLALRRWRLPRGVFTLIFTLNTGLMAVFNPEVVVLLLPCAWLSGMAADLLYQILQPSVERLESIRVFAFAVPAILYLFYFLNLAIVEPLRFQSRITWSVHFWAGSIVLAGLVGFLLSYAMFPPLGPTEKQEEPRP
jgi:hypothetical protein